MRAGSVSLCDRANVFFRNLVAVLRGDPHPIKCFLLIVVPEHVVISQTTRRCDVSCERSATIPLPIYASVLHEVDVPRFGRRQPCIDIAEVPTLCGAAVPAGESLVRVHLPTLAAIPGYWLRRRTGVSASANR